MKRENKKLLAEEYLNLLFDRDTFYKVNSSNGVILGAGLINGRVTFSYFQKFRLMGGALGKKEAETIISLLKDILKFKIPLVAINDVGGARINEGIDSMRGYGKIFYYNSLLKGVVPQISVINGFCAGGCAYSSAICDFTIMIKNRSRMFVAGPKIIEFTTGDKISGRELGGPEIHSLRSGNIDFIVENEEKAIFTVRKLLSFLPINYMQKFWQVDKISDFKEDKSLNEFASKMVSKNYDMREIVKRVVDGEDFLEIQKDFAPNLIAGFGKIGGISVGIIGNQPMELDGALDINSSYKATRFIEFCNNFKIPIISFVDTSGYLNGIIQEYGGVARHGAKMLFSYVRARVPKITLIIKKAYGIGCVSMGSKDLGADRVFAWPTAEIGVMEPGGAVPFLLKNETKNIKNYEKVFKDKVKYYKDRCRPLEALEKGFIDEIIKPSETRKKIFYSLKILTSNLHF